MKFFNKKVLIICRHLAPEYYMHGIVDEKTDVFAFGVFLLEVISGRKPVDGSHQSLHSWVSLIILSNMFLTFHFCVCYHVDSIFHYIYIYIISSSSRKTIISMACFSIKLFNSVKKMVIGCESCDISFQRILCLSLFQFPNGWRSAIVFENIHSLQWLVSSRVKLDKLIIWHVGNMVCCYNQKLILNKHRPNQFWTGESMKSW